MTRLPTAAWIGTGKSWRGMTSLSRRTSALPLVVGLLAVHDDRERVHRLSLTSTSILTRSPGAVLVEAIVHRGIAARARLELIVEIDQDLGQRDVKVEHHAALRPGIPSCRTRRAAPVASSIIGPIYSVGVKMLMRIHGSRISSISSGVGQVGGVVDDRRSRRRVRSTWYSTLGAVAKQVQLVLALQALLDDLHVQQAQEAAAEAKAQRRRGLGLVDQRGVVELQLFQRVAQRLIVLAVHRIEPGKDHRLGRADSRAAARRAGARRVGDACRPRGSRARS